GDWRRPATPWTCSVPLRRRSPGSAASTGGSCSFAPAITRPCTAPARRYSHPIRPQGYRWRSISTPSPCSEPCDALRNPILAAGICCEYTCVLLSDCTPEEREGMALRVIMIWTDPRLKHTAKRDGEVYPKNRKLCDEMDST